MEGSSTDCAYARTVAHLRCLSKRAFESLEVVDPDDPDHISVTVESLVVVDPDGQPDLGDVEEADVVPRFRSIPPLIPPPNTKEATTRARAI